jgi:hypothetical protein
VLPDIVFPPPGEGEIVEDILEQILPEDDRSVSRSDSFQALEGRETSTEAAGKTYKDEVSVDGTGHTSVVISVKLDLGRMREPHSC